MTETSQALAPRPETLPALPAVDRHPVPVYLASLGSPHSRRAMLAALERMAELASGGRVGALELPWQRMTYAETSALRARLAELYAPAGANLRLAALRGVLRESWRLGLMDAETYHRAIDLRSVRGSTLPKGRALSAGEVRALFDACARDDNRAAGARDSALFAVCYGGGLRRSEAVALDLADFNRETGALTVRSGKGRKDRSVYATNGARAALEHWLDLRGEEPGALLCPVSKSGTVEVRRLSPQAVLNVCHKRAGGAKLEPFAPHDLRRSCVSALLDAGADLSVVQKLAGHASPVTTARYDRRGERAKLEAAELLHVPFAPVA